MPGIAHKVISKIAYDVLPKWEKEFWQDEAVNIVKYASLPDEVTNPKCKEFCMMPNGAYIPHGPTDEQFTMVPFVQSYNRKSTIYVVDYYFKKVVDAIARHKSGESIIWAAVLGHYIEDSSHPIHIVDNTQVYDFFPPPKGKYWQLHRFLDDVPVDEPSLKQVLPQLLGLTVEEAIFHIVSRYEKMVACAKGKLAPLVMKYYACEDLESLKELLGECYLQAAHLTASIWHTAHSIANNRFEPRESEELKTVKLNDMAPAYQFTIDPYFFTPLFNNDCNGKGNKIPIVFPARQNIDGKAQKYDNGIAMNFGYVGYDIPPRVYREFRTRVGVLSPVPEKISFVFKVVLDGGPPRYADYHTRLLDYGGPVVYDSGALTAEDTVKEIVVSLGNTPKLTLLAERSLLAGGSNAQNVHAIWAAPLLLK